MTGWEEIGDRVWTRRYESLSLRAGVVGGDGGVLVVDTRSHRGEGAELAADVAALGAGPVRWVANTHHHWDHVFGNATFRPAPIWGHARCAELLASGGEQMRVDAARYLPAAAAEIAAVEIVPPDRLLTERASLDLGWRRVELLHLGRGHTDNDVVVAVPDAAVLFAGDLVEQGAPPAFDDAFPLDWPATLDRLGDLVAGPVVPGHGDVVDAAFVRAQRDLIAAAVGGADVFPAATMADVRRRVAWQRSTEAA